MCVRVRARVCTCINVCVYACVRTCVCACVCGRACVYMCPCVRACVRGCVCVYLRACACACVSWVGQTVEDRPYFHVTTHALYYKMNCFVCFSTMPPRATAARHLLVFVVVIVALAATTEGTVAPPGDQRITTSKDGCRIQPTRDGVGVDVDCAGLRLGHIPDDLPRDMSRLKMRRNNILQLNGRPFEIYTELTSLDLSRNGLHDVGANVFAGLRRLEELDLTYNHLCMDKNTFSVDLFSHMTSLRRLTMTSNACSQHVEYPDEALAKLTNLEFLSLTGIPTRRLGDGFGRLTKLKTLAFGGHNCTMPIMTNETFDSLRHVQLSHLALKTCRVKTLETGALEPLSHLTTLNLACNKMVKFINVYNAIIAVKDMKLKTIVVDDVEPEAMLLFHEQFAHNAFTNVERLSLRANYITEVDVRIMRPLKNLTHFNIGYNVITSIRPTINSSEALFKTLFGLPLDVIDASDVFTSPAVYRHRYCFREAMSDDDDPIDPTEYFFRRPPPLVDLDFSRVRPSARPSAGHMTEKEEDKLLTIPPSVQVVYADHVYRGHVAGITVKLNVSADNDVVVMNISYNPFSAIGSIRGLHRLQLADIRNCSVETITQGAFSDTRMLKYLYLNGNNIGTNGADLKGAFDGLSSLEVLDLSGNAISQIHVSAFSSLTNLRVLSLQGNRLASASFNISGLRRLTTLNIADNHITHIHKNITKRRDVHVIIHGNPVAVPKRKSHKNLLVVIGVICGVVLLVALAVAVFALRRQRTRSSPSNARQQTDDDEELLRPNELPAEEPAPSAQDGPMPGEIQLQDQKQWGQDVEN